MMTAKEKREIAEMTAKLVVEKMKEDMDRMIPLRKAHEDYGWSAEYLYKNWDRLGGVKTGGRIFFSRRNLETIIRNSLV